MKLMTIPDPVDPPAGPTVGIDPPPPGKSIQPCDRVTWHFGDGTADVMLVGSDTVSHIFAVPGVYQVTADIDNTLGHFSTDVHRQLITSNPPTLVKFAQTTYTVLESAGLYAVSLERSGNLTAFSTVRWDLGDYFDGDGSRDVSLSVTPRVPATGGWVTFAPNETVKTFSIPIIDDDYYEGSSSHYITIRALDGTGFGSVAYPVAATITGFQVLDDESQPTASIADATVIEGTGGVRTADFVVTMSATMVFNERVFGWAIDGSARRGIDYGINPDGSVMRDTDLRCTIPAGRTSCTLRVPVTTDAKIEPDQTFTVGFGMQADVPTPKVLRGYATGTIVDDDYSFSPSAPFLVVGTKAKIQLRVGQSFSSPTALTVSVSAPTIVHAPAYFFFEPGSDQAEIEINALSSGIASLAVQLTTNRGGGRIGVVIKVGGSPALESITPNSGPTTGGTRVVLRGTDLGPQCAVMFGNDVPSGIAQFDGGIIVITPPHSIGPVDVKVACGDELAVITQGFNFVQPRRRTVN